MRCASKPPLCLCQAWRGLGCHTMWPSQSGFWFQIFWPGHKMGAVAQPLALTSGRGSGLQASIVRGFRQGRAPQSWWRILETP